MTFLTQTIAGGDQNDIQYNRDGFLYGDDNLEWNPVTKTMTVTGDLTFPFVAIYMRIIIVSGSIDSVVRDTDGFGYVDGTYSVPVPGGIDGSLDIFITNNTVSNVVITDVGNSYADGTINFYPVISRYGTITANKYTNNFVTIENDEITGISDLTVSGTVDTQALTIDNIDISSNNITNVETLQASSVTSTTMAVGNNVTIDDTNGIQGLTSVVTTGTATISDLNVNGLTIVGSDISGINNLSATGTISVGNSITAGTVSIAANSITGVNNVTATGTLSLNSLNINSGAATIDTLGNFTTNTAVTVSDTLTASTITDGTMTVNNGTMTGVTDLNVSGNITLQGTGASITIG